MTRARRSASCSTGCASSSGTPGRSPGRTPRTTTKGVKGFQGKRKFTVTGEVDQRTWSKLVAMTRTPTRAERHNVLVAGPALMKSGLQRPGRPRPAGPAEADRLVLRRRHRQLRLGHDQRRTRVPGQARHPGHRCGRPADPGPAAGHDAYADQRRALQQGADRIGVRSRPALPDRPGDLRQQADQLPGLGGRRAGPAADGRALRVGPDADPRGLVPGRLEVPPPLLLALRHLDAVRDVLQRRSGRALLARLRRPRLQRRLARLRQRPQPRRHPGPLRLGPGRRQGHRLPAETRGRLRRAAQAAAVGVRSGR